MSMETKLTGALNKGSYFVENRADGVRIGEVRKAGTGLRLENPYWLAWTRTYFKIRHGDGIYGYHYRTRADAVKAVVDAAEGN